MEATRLGPEQLLGDFAAAMVQAIHGRADRDEQRRAVRALSSCTYSLHELLKDASEEYRRALREDEDGQTVQALVFVRGAADHRGLQAFTRRGVAYIPGSVVGLRWAWLPTEAVRDLLPNPSARDAKRQTEMVDLYDRHLADHTLLQTFDVAGDLFRRVAA